jgi:iron complex outermembrane recepter protein
MKFNAALAKAVRLAIIGEALGLAAGMLVTAPAVAQDQAAPVGLEEVTVTARKRSETVLEVPVAISALGAAQLEQAGIKSISDLGAYAPGLNFTQQVGNGPGGRAQGAIQFRGMSSQQGTNREQSGSIFVDGIFVSGGVASVDTSDVQRIEILRGPQNAYFGRNTFGGAINFVTRNPGEEFQGEVSAGAASYGGFDFRAKVEGPLIDGKLSGRLSGVSYKKGAQYTAHDGGKLGEQTTQSLSGTLFATLTDNWTMRLRAHIQNDDDGAMDNAYVRGTQYGSLCPGQTFTAANASGAAVSFALGRPYFCSESQIPSPSVLVSQNTSMFPAVLAGIGLPNLWNDIVVNNSLNNPILARAPHMNDFGMKRDVVRASFQTEYTFANDITLAASYGFDQSYQNTVYDPDRADAENTWAVLPAISHSWQAEVRLQSGQEQRVRWLLGYSTFKGEWETQQLAYQINTAVGGAIPRAGVQNPPRVDDVAETPAVFGSIEGDLLKNLTIGAEVRRQTDKQSSLNADLVTRTKWELKNTMPRYFVRYSPIQDLNLYATYGKGVTPGQLNGNWNSYSASQQAEICAQFPTSCGGALAKEPTVENYEIGIKQRLLDGRLQYSLAAYKMDWNDVNTVVTVFVSTTPFAVPFVVRNNAKLKGLEFEGSYLLTDAWSVDLSATLQKNEYTLFYNPAISTLTSGATYYTGNEVPKQPDKTAVLSSTYRGKLGDWRWFVRGDAMYTGKMWDSEANIFQTGGYTKFNARLGFDKDNLSIEAYGKNIFNDKHWMYAARSTSLAEPGALLQVRSQPGWFGYNPANPNAVTTVQGLMLNSPDRPEYGVKVTYRF